MQENHATEQYFFDDATIAAIGDLLAQFDRPCVLCAPMLGRELHRRGRMVRVLDCDERFADLPGFVRWDIHRPAPLADTFDVIVCDPPFFNASLSQLFTAVRLLARFDFQQNLMVSYLSRRRHAVMSTFARFNLQPTGYHPGYQTVQACERNDIEFFANFPTGPGQERGHTRN